MCFQCTLASVCLPVCLSAYLPVGQLRLVSRPTLFHFSIIIIINDSPFRLSFLLFYFLCFFLFFFLHFLFEYITRMLNS